MSTTKPALYEDDTGAWRLIEADALMLLAKLPDTSIDAIVTDPPYALSLGGAAWDRFDQGELPASEAFERWTARWASECLRVLKPGGHLLAVGAPRTFHRLVAGVEDAGLQVRDQLLWLNAQGLPKSHRLPGGLGTTLKPAYEPILLARKPFTGRTIDNLERHGTGALNIDATRVGEARYWPAHITLTHSPDCTEKTSCTSDCPVRMIDRARPDLLPSRLLFCAKAPRTEREAGCEQLPRRTVALYTGKRHSPRIVRNPHPTVKPLELMRWLVRLVTPPDGLVLDPFCGSGSTGAATLLEGRRFLGIEREPEYVDVACARLTHWAHQATDGKT
ncbi:MAG: DNA-methyltransferase [Solirubrobacteraceae bacterium]